MPTMNENKRRRVIADSGLRSPSLIHKRKKKLGMQPEKNLYDDNEFTHHIAQTDY